MGGHNLTALVTLEDLIGSDAKDVVGKIVKVRTDIEELIRNLESLSFKEIKSRLNAIRENISTLDMDIINLCLRRFE